MIAEFDRRCARAAFAAIDAYRDKTAADPTRPVPPAPAEPAPAPAA